MEKGGSLDKKLTSEKDFSWVSVILKKKIEEDSEMALAMGAIHGLTEVLKESKAGTIMELQKELDSASRAIVESHHSISLKSGADLFIRFITRTLFDYVNFDVCKKKLIERGEQLKQKTDSSRMKVSKTAQSFFRDGMVVMTHGYSRVVLAVLKAAQKDKRITVIQTESRPELSGHKMAKRLSEEAKIPVTMITDSAAAHVMEKVDMVLVGAEAVVESGGLINEIGTYQLSLIAKSLSKPFYVAAESFKMTRLYPTSQTDIPNRQCKGTEDMGSNINIDYPQLDFTPPENITLLFTDLGILMPSSVSDELIQLYN